MKKRIVNIRVMTSIVIGLIAGILFSYSLVLEGLKIYKIVLFSLGTIIVASGFIVYAVLTRKSNAKIESRKDVSILLIISTIGFVVAVLIGALYSYPAIYKLNNIESFSNVTVEGVVSDYVDDNTTYKKFILDDCLVVDGGKQTNLEYKICVYTYAFADIKLGDKIFFVGDLEAFNYKNKNEFDKVIQKIGYSTYINYSDMVVSSGDIEIKDLIKENVRELLHKNLNSDNANITYAILFGEKQGLNQDIKDVFSYAGISHILAVSGLHIGVLVAFISFILDKLKINGYVKLILLVSLLGFYCYLCSFSPSVLRASIMAILLVLCKIWLIEYDGISSLSIAGLIILLLNPLNLFSISFQLSFLCVLSMIALAPSITRLFKKIKVPKFLSSALAISISTNLVILPVCANFFDTVSFLGVFTNLLVLPIFSITYVLMFLVVVLSLFLPFMSIFFIIPSLFLHLIKVIADFSINISFGVLKIFNISYWVLFLIILTVLTLHFLMINTKLKGVIVSILALVIGILFVCFNIPNSYKESNVLIYSQSYSNVVLYIEDNNVTLIGCNIQDYQLSRQMKHFKISKIDNIIAYDLQLNNLDNLLKIYNLYNVNNIYIPNKFNYNEITDLFNEVTYYERKLSLNKIDFRHIVYKDNIIGVYFNLNEKYFLIPEIKPTIAEGNYIESYFSDNVDYLIVKNLDVKLDFEKLNANNIIATYQRESELENVICLKEIIGYQIVG